MTKVLTTTELTSLFQHLQTPYIVFAINDPEFTILEENKAHASITMVNRSDVLGRPLLTAFPDSSAEYRHTGKSEMLESIRRVIKSGKPDVIPQLNYSFKDKSGTLKNMDWSITHYPLFDDEGNVASVYQESKDITEEVKLKERLDKAEHQLNQILASSLVGTWYWDIKKSLIFVDANLAQMFGIDSKVASKGVSLSRFIKSVYKEDRSAVEVKIQEALLTGSIYEAEYRTVASDGKIRWVMARGIVEYDKSTKPTSFTGSIIDVTDRKKAEYAVTESENRLRFMANSMPQLVWITRPDGYHEYYNQQWYDYTGTEVGSTDGGGWNNLFHPEDRDKALKLWEESLKSGKLYEVEYRLYHAASKNYRWVIGRALPFKDKSGTILKWYGTCTDIDEQKRLSQLQTFLADISKELSSSLDLQEMLNTVTSLAVPVFADWCAVHLYDEIKGFKQASVAHSDPNKINKAKKYLKLNPLEADQKFGIPRILKTGKLEYYPYISDETLEQYIDDPETLAYVKSLNIHSIIIAPIRINGAVCGGITFISSDSGRYYTDDDMHFAEEIGSRISLAMTNSHLYSESLKEINNRQKLERALIIEKQKLESRVIERTMQLQQTNKGLRDEIMKRHEIEKELQSNTKELARSNAELEDFAYVASHDLQEPLRKIQAFGNLLENEYHDKLGEGADYISRMNVAATRMSTLIQDLLAFSRVSTSPHVIQSINVREIIKDVLIDLESRLEEVNGKVIVEDMPNVMADATHIRQLFQNLISNGLKFHKHDVPPIITIKAKQYEAHVEFIVKDNGIGFDEKYLDRIFSVFQRLHGRGQYEGTGIGLAVSRKIVERYGGSITAKSANNKGATFIIKLPKIKET